MTVEELEIIIRANITDAIKGIKQITDEVKKRISNSTAYMKELSESSKSYAKELKPMVQQTKTTMKQVTNEVKNAKEKIKSEVSKIDLAFNTDKMDFTSLESKMNELKEIRDKITSGDISLISEEEKNKLNDIVFKILELEEAMKRASSFSINSNMNLDGQVVEPSLNLDTSKKVIDVDIKPARSKFEVLKGYTLEAILKIEDGFKAVGKKMYNAINSGVEKSKRSLNKLKSSNAISDISKSITKGIGSIKKFALSLLSIRTAFSAVSKAAQAYLSFDSQLSDSIQNSWNVLGSLLAPMLEYVASLFAKLVSYIATFIKALTGIDLVARANAKALNKQAGAAKKVSEVQLGLDEFHTINKDTNGGSDTPKIEIEEIDTSKLDVLFKWIDKAKELLSTLFEPFKKAWENKGKSVIDSFKNAFVSLKELGASVFTSILEVWTNGTGQEIIENCLEGWSLVFDIVSALAGAFNNAWSSAGVGTSILQSLADIFIVLQEFGLSIGDSLKKWVISQSFQDALNRIFTFTDDIFGMIKDIAKWMLNMYDTYLKPVIDEKLLPAISDIITALGDIWNFIQPLVQFCVELIEYTLEPVIQGLCDFIGGIIDILRGVSQFISGVFTLDWKKAWSGMQNIFSEFCNMIGSLFKTPVNIIISATEFLINKLIDGFNALKKAINKLSFDVPDWVPVIGGKKWGFNIPLSEPISIPRLYTGGVLKEDSIVRVADYSNARSNPEIVSPKNMMKEVFKETIEETGLNYQQSQPIEADVTGELRIDGNDLVIVYDKNKKNKGYDGGKNPSFAY